MLLLSFFPCDFEAELLGDKLQAASRQTRVVSLQAVPARSRVDPRSHVVKNYLHSRCNLEVVEQFL